MTEAKTIAAGLTKAQRRNVLSGLEPDGVGKWPARSALLRKGLAAYRPWNLTPLGLAVRQHLKDADNG